MMFRPMGGLTLSTARSQREESVMGKLEGKVAFITGVARGQGRAHAVRMAEEGADIIGVDLCGQIDTVEYAMSTPDDLDQTVKLVEDTGRRIVVRQADVRDRAELRVTLEEGVAELAHLDIAVANAGIAPITVDADQPQQAWQDAIDVLLTGAYHTVDLASRFMVEQGRGGSIVITSSVAGIKGLGSSLAASGPGLVGYVAAKHGVIGIMRHYAAVLAPHRIRVNSLHPTGVNTPMIANEVIAGYFEQFPEAAAALQNALPVELVEVDDVANAAVWLCSDEARYVTGVMLPVDAGLTVR
jgi:SDR family mycofactocin-dependent oxidoreductase